MCRHLAKQHVDDPGIPAAPNDVGGYAEWTQIALILFRVELEKSLRETEDYLIEMPGVLAVFDLNEHRTTVRFAGGKTGTGCVNSATCSAEAWSRRTGVVKPPLTQVLPA